MKATNEEIEVTPTEDLMREHGLLNRVLLIYEEILLRISDNRPFRLSIVHDATSFIQEFIEDYHEKLEETQIFPLFAHDHLLAPLVATLIEQHQAGRKITSTIQNLVAQADTIDKIENKKEFSALLASFICMYRAHETREDTNLFPKVKKLLSPKAYADMAELFEQTEHQLFGKDGFNSLLAKIENMEKELDINDLASYTPNEKKSQKCFTQNCLFCEK